MNIESELISLTNQIIEKINNQEKTRLIRDAKNKLGLAKFATDAIPNKSRVEDNLRSYIELRDKHQRDFNETFPQEIHEEYKSLIRRAYNL